MELRQEVGWNPWPHVDALLGDGDLTGLSVLDVGCGTGEVAAGLMARGAHVTGLDASERMCQLAAERVPEGFFLWHDLAAGLPFETGVFDVVLALGCIEYVPHIDYACAELVRVTKPGGRVLYTVERCEEGVDGGSARVLTLYEEWSRYRQTYDEAVSTANKLLSEAHFKRVPGYFFEESGKWIGYVRVMGRV